MSYILARQVYEVDNLSRMDFNILFHLAFAAAQDKDTVNIALETIARKVRCSKRMVQYSLRRLESDGFLVPLGKPKGRGHILMYFVTVTPHVEIPVVPPTNGHVPSPTNGHKPHDPYKPEPLTPEQIEARRAQLAAKRAEIAAKPRPEKTRERPGRTERESTRMVQGRTSLDGYPGGDETS